MATLHTSTAVIFTNRLRGVKTCSLYTKGASEGSVSLPQQWVSKDVPYQSQIIPDRRIIDVEREILHHREMLSGYSAWRVLVRVKGEFALGVAETWH
jgi:hypothetical protein